MQAGEAPAAVAQDMGLYTNRIFIWLVAYRAGGWDALRAKEAMGRPKRADARQIHRIYDTVTLRSPLQMKLPLALWARAQIRTLIQGKFGVKLSLASVERLLAQLGLTGQKPLFCACQRDASRVERWLKEEYPKIRTQARREKAGIFFGDESGVRSDFHSGTTWAAKGETPVVRVTGARSSLKQDVGRLSARGAALQGGARGHQCLRLHRAPKAPRAGQRPHDLPHL